MGVAFAVPFMYYFQQLQLHFKLIFAVSYYYISSKSVSQIFKVLFQTENINIFVLSGVFLSRYVQLKTSFPGEKNISGEIESHFRREAIVN